MALGDAGPKGRRVGEADGAALAGVDTDMVGQAGLFEAGGSDGFNMAAAAAPELLWHGHHSSVLAGPQRQQYLRVAKPSARIAGVHPRTSG